MELNFNGLPNHAIHVLGLSDEDATKLRMKTKKTAPSRNLRNMTPDVQGYACQCMLGSLVPRLLGQCLLDSPSLFPPDTLPYRLWPATCSPISTDPSPPFSSLLISYVAHSSSLPILIELVVFDWHLSLQPPAHADSMLANFSTLKMEAILFSETSVHTRTTRHHIPENGILKCAFLLKFFNTHIRRD
jgi:hypothetical protein